MRHGNFDDQPQTRINWRTVAFIWPYLMEYKQRVAVALLCLVFAKIANVAGPYLLKLVVDALNTETVGTALAVIPIALILIYGFARFSNVIMGEIRDSVFGRVTEHAMRRIGLQVFQHIHALDLDFHLNRRTGGLARDIERGTTGISFLMRFFVFNIFPTLIEVTMIAGILFYNYGAGFAIIILLSVSVYIAYSIIATERRTQYVREVNLADSASNTRAIDSLLNYETVKYFTNEQFEAERYDQGLRRWESARRNNRLSLFALNGGQALIIAAATTAMIWLAASEVSKGNMSIGDFVAVNSYMMILFIPLSFLGFVYREIKGSMANIEKMFELLSIQPKVADLDNAPPLQISQGAVCFNNVSFDYHSDRKILKAVTLSIKPGQKLAVVGASGAGKSTLVKLLFRFYDTTAGTITIDGQDISRVSQLSLRQAIGIVPQDTVLFNDTIFENVRYGQPSASDTEVEQAIELAHLDEFIQQLPEGRHTHVGERGLKLSGGEKQRVAIARTLLKRAPILVFDEATSSLDSKSEQAILAAIREISQNHTSLVIAHRLSTIVDADIIVVLDRGEIVEQGNHQQLLDIGGHYADLWVNQKKRQSAKP
ncbi:ABC transporter, ATP-binding/permease protein [marine gamma proteobacterium HTCC2143]|jgi:ABC-type transport system involved in Fe-S cluster assembly fused permease/ATPase subunit|uniref:ABC transporter, ATP-binding/permease protein n=1 Tax=marine gamma proteobacterium HTCC2143 TaxID=247633 RepID=A0YFL8_9GAMM|nr:ABC transporter, ATP-binding/permease protein [marine gamma proteobacterium HTCC2143]